MDMRSIILAVLFSLVASAAETDLSAQLATIQADANHKKEAAITAWLNSLDLTFVQVPDAGEDARPSERKAVQDAMDLNAAIGMARRLARGEEPLAGYTLLSLGDDKQTLSRLAKCSRKGSGSTTSAKHEPTGGFVSAKP